MEPTGTKESKLSIVLTLLCKLYVYGCVAYVTSDLLAKVAMYLIVQFK